MRKLEQYKKTFKEKIVLHAKGVISFGDLQLDIGTGVCDRAILSVLAKHKIYTKAIREGL